MAADTIPARVLAGAESRGAAPAYHERSGGTWQATSWADYGSQVRDVARSLVALGVEPGNPVTILGFNQRNSRNLENLKECPALRDGMTALIEPVRRMASTIGILGKGGWRPDRSRHRSG